MLENKISFLHNNRLKNIKVFPKILFYCLFVTSIPIAGFTYQLHLRELDQKEVVEQRLLQSADTIATHIDTWIDKNLTQSRFVATLEPFRRMDAQAQVPILKAATENLEWVALTFVADLQGNAIARSDNQELYNYSDRKYFKEVVSGKQIGQQVLIGKLKPVPLHCFAIPIQKTSGQMTGVLTQCSTLQDISDQITRFKIGQTGYVFLIDDSNRLIAHGKQGHKLMTRLEDLSDHPSLHLEKRNVSTMHYEDNKNVVIVLPVGPNWKLILQQDYDEAFSSYLESRTYTILMGITSISLALLFSFLTSYNISAPIRKLTNIANAYSKGIFVKNVLDEGRKDEIGDLARAISRMSKAIQIAVGHLQKQKQKKE
jgi:methyl-accepting chemotaxis protein